jgi:hypothetical protein
VGSLLSWRKGDITGRRRSGVLRTFHVEYQLLPLSLVSLDRESVGITAFITKVWRRSAASLQLMVWVTLRVADQALRENIPKYMFQPLIVGGVVQICTCSRPLKTAYNAWSAY